MEMKVRTDIFDKCLGDGGYYGAQRAEDDHYFTRPIVDPIPGRLMEFEGSTRIMWSVNNYLGLAENEQIKAVAVEAANTYGTSAPMGSRMMTGNTPHHLEFERQLASFTQKEAAILFNYGYLGVIGTITSLAGPDDTLVMDKLAHACIVDAAMMAPAQVRVFKHNNMKDLESVLQSAEKQTKGGIMVLVEGVYGMTGDLARLDEIVALKRKYNFRIFVDDAHGWGVMGKQGRGVADHFGVQDEVDVYFGTFAKAFASIGGFSSTSKAVRDWISYNARTQVFAKSLPMIYVKSLQKTLELVQDGDANRAKMWENSARLKNGLSDLGYFIGNGESPICAVFAPINGQQTETVGKRLVRFLRDRGVFATAITYPVIPLGLCMFRMIPTTSHTQDDVDRTVQVFREMRDELGLDLKMSPEDQTKISRVYGKGAA